MICQLQGTVYKPRNKKVFYYETESGAEFDKNAELIGLEKEDVSIKLGDQIVRLSPFLQGVQEAIRESLRFQDNARTEGQIERECREKKGQIEIDPGIWRYPGSTINLLEFADYPVKIEEEEKKE